MKFLNLRQFRKERNLTQREVALALGVSQSVVSYMENGCMEVTDYQLGKFVKAFQVEDIAPYIYKRESYVSPEMTFAHVAKQKPRMMSGDWDKPKPLGRFGDISTICHMNNVHVASDGTIVMDPNNGLGFGLTPYIIEPEKLTRTDLIQQLSKEEWFDDEMYEAFKRIYVIACSLAKIEPVSQEKQIK